jgi:hypothetical protein
MIHNLENKVIKQNQIMILLEINPLSKPVAISEMLMLITVIALVGWLIGHWTTGTKIRSLREALTSMQTDLDDCHRFSNTPTRGIVQRHPGSTVSIENLKMIEGIGPKIEHILHGAGITNFDTLAKSNINTLKDLLQNAGNRYKLHDPTSWPEQATLARDGMWGKLSDFQDKLSRGKSV